MKKMGSFSLIILTIVLSAGVAITASMATIGNKGKSAEAKQGQANKTAPANNNEAKLELIESISEDWTFTATARGNYLVLGGSGGLQVLDMSKPAGSRKIAQKTMYGINSLVVQGNQIFVGIAGPILIEHEDSTREWVRVHGFAIFDFTDIEKLELLGTYDQDASMWQLEVQGQYAYLVNRQDGMGIVDISNPAEPLFLGSVEFPGEWDLISDLAVRGNYAYVAAGLDGMGIIDVSQKDNPVIHGAYNEDHWNFTRSLELQGNSVILGDSDGLSVVNISNPAEPKFVGKYDDITPWKMASQGNSVYVTDAGDNSIKTFNISKGAPELTSSLSVGYRGTGIMVNQNQVFVVKPYSGGGIEIFRIVK